MTPSNDIMRLIEIMAALRDPQAGCAWDVEQTFASIAPYTIEEAYEVADAIERGNPEDLREELGDLLLQVVYHSRMAEEAGLFAFADVVQAVTTKMIRRHPHVFGDAQARSAGSAKGQWERIKLEERAEKATMRAQRLQDQDRQDDSSAVVSPGHLDSVPGTFPALTLSLKVQQRASTVGFDWQRAEPILEKIREELGELEEVLATSDRDRMEDELGDLLFAVVNLARHAEVDPEKALRRTVRKFRQRFTFIERQLGASGRSLADADLQEMEDLWQRAKTQGPATGFGFS